MPGSAPSVDNKLLSSLVETLLVFEHLFDTECFGVSRTRGRALLLRFAPPCTVDPVLGDVHGQAERDPHIARRVASGESVRGGHPELVQNDIANEGATKVLAELGGHGQGELGVFHPFSVSGLRIGILRRFGIQSTLTLRFCRPP